MSAGLSWPVAMLIGFVHRYGVNLPIADGWDEGRFLLAWHMGGPSWSRLFSPHNEHVMALPRLAALLLASATHWNVKAEMYASAVVASLALIALLAALSRLSPGPRRSRLVVTVSVALLVLGWTQWQNWLWGFQLAWLMTELFVVAAMVVLAMAPPGPSAMAVSTTLLAAATFSSAGGWIGWVAALPLAAGTLRSGAGRRGRRSLAIAIYAGAFALTTAVFLALAERSRLSLSAVVTDPVGCGRFLLSLLGWTVVSPLHHVASPPELGSPTAALATAAGTLLVVAWLVCTASAITSKLSNGRPFLFAQGLTLFGLGFSALVAVGRLRTGPQLAFESRYLTLTQYFPIGLLILLLVIAGPTSNRGWRRAARAAAEGLALVLVLGSLLAYRNLPSLGADMKRAHARLKATLQLSVIWPDQPDLRRLARRDDPRPLLELVSGLEAEGLYSPLRLRTREDRSVANAQFRVAPDGSCGRLESRRFVGGDLVLYGWAILPPHTRPADTVVAAECGPGPAFRLLGIDDGERVLRRDVARRLRNSAYLLSGWLIRLPRQTVEDERRTAAFAFDGESDRFYELPGPRRTSMPGVLDPR